MKILFYSHFFSPEVGAASIRSQYFVAALRNAGHEIKVITPRPNYPSGKSYEGFDFFYHHDKIKNIVYLPIFTPKKHSIIGRGLSYISYALVSFLYSLLDSFQYEIIITSSPPITTAFAAALVSKFRRKPLILDIRDLWPDIGIELGVIKAKPLIRILEYIDKLLLNSASSVIIPLDGFKSVMKRKGVTCPVTVINNGADTDIFKPLTKEQIDIVREKFGLPITKKIAIYFGFFNFGMNDVMTLAAALSGLGESGNDFHFLFVGAGSLKDEFVEKISGKINFTFLEPLGKEELSQVVAASDLSVIPLKRTTGSTGGFIPVKCLEAWACGIPVLLSSTGDTELNSIFEESAAGEVIESGNSVSLREGTKRMLNRVDLKELGANGRNFIVAKFDRMKLSQNICDVITEIMNE